MKNGLWQRVCSLDADPFNRDRAKANQATKINPVFIDACSKAGIDPTTRQASKWNHKKGAAFKTKNHIRF